MNVSLNALGQNALRSQVVATQNVPVDAPLEQLLASAMITAANTAMLLHRRKQIDEKSREDIHVHYFFPFQAGIVAQNVLNLVVCAYQHVGWSHTRIVGDRLVIAREPYVVSKGRGELQSELPFGTGDAAGPEEDDLLVGHSAGGYSHQTPPATSVASG